MALRKGLIVNTWEVLGRIGTGGMASVWKVRHTVFHEERAMKAVHANLLKDSAGSYERFLLEARNARKVQHPNVVQVFDAGVQPDPDAEPGSDERLDTPWLVMELLDGHDLAKEMKLRGAEGLPREEVASIFEQIGAGVGAAHAKDVIHLDLKPENLFLAMVEGRRVLKVLDFGISKALSDGRSSITLTQRLLSPLWTSPEQLVGRTASRAADIWALGLIAFYLLTGRQYWRAANGAVTDGKDPVAVVTTEIIASMNGMEPASVRAASYGVASRLPEGFDAWFAGCVASDPSQRHKTAKGCCDALVSVLRPVVTPPPIVDPPPVPPPLSGTELMKLPMPGIGLAPVAPAPSSPVSASVAATGGAAWPWFAGIAGVSAVAVFSLCVGPSLVGRAHDDAGTVADVTTVVRDAPPPPLHCPAGMVLAPAGEFTMGTDGDAGESDERPAHRVRLSAFCIDRTEVTVSQYRACVADTGSGCTAAFTTLSYPGVTDSDHRAWDSLCNRRFNDRDDHPINCIDWTQANAYCHAVGKRLPTEAEWEYAARGSDGRVYPWGKEAPGPSRLNGCGSGCRELRRSIWSRNRWPFTGDAPLVAYVGEDGSASTAPVGRFPLGASPFGALDMAGNVSEWTSDWYGAYQDNGSATGPVDGTLHVIRGGSWDFNRSAWFRAANRARGTPTARYVGLGVRCARGATP